MYRLMAIGLLLMVATGCGSGLETAPVSGVITLNGEPLPDVVVTFTPQLQDTSDAPASTGKTDSTGHYSLTVVTTEDEGAVLGNHMVSIAAPGPEGEADTEEEDIIDPNAEDSIPDHNFTFEVTAGGSEAANFNLEGN